MPKLTRPESYLHHICQPFGNPNDLECVMLAVRSATITEEVQCLQHENNENQPLVRWWALQGSNL
jgi:hypothetical protein